MTDQRPTRSPLSPAWLSPATEQAMRAAYDLALNQGRGSAAAIAAACTALLIEAPGLTPDRIGEAIGTLVVAVGTTDAARAARSSSVSAIASERGQGGPEDADDPEFVAALAYALRHDERGRPRRGGWEFAAELAAEHLAGHLKRANFVVSRRRPGTPHRTG